MDTTQKLPTTRDGHRTGPPAPPPVLPNDDTAGSEPRGCLYALSQPPLMLFLAVIATLLAITGAHDLLFL